MDPNENVEEDQVADKINQEFRINLPGQNLPIAVRFIAFFTLIGGFSIIGSLFADIIRPTGEDLSFFVIRIIAGVIAILTAYGIIEHRRWSIYLYALFTVVALFSNPFLAIIPLAVVVYLYTQRKYLNPSIADMYLASKLEEIKKMIIKKPPIDNSSA